MEVLRQRVEKQPIEDTKGKRWEPKKNIIPVARRVTELSQWLKSQESSK